MFQSTQWVGGVYGQYSQLLLTPGNVARPRLHKCPSLLKKIGAEVGAFDTGDSVRQRCFRDLTRCTGFGAPIAKTASESVNRHARDTSVLEGSAERPAVDDLALPTRRKEVMSRIFCKKVLTMLPSVVAGMGGA